MGWPDNPATPALYLNAASFVVSALLLATIQSAFNIAGDEPKEATTIMHDIREGLRYVLSHPVLRNISLMMALINFVGVTTGAQLVLFANEARLERWRERFQAIQDLSSEMTIPSPTR